MEISLAAEQLFSIKGFSVTNSLCVAWGVAIFLIVVAIFVGRKIKMAPVQGFAGFVEWAIEGLFNFFDSVTQDRKLTKRFFPLVATIFLVVVVSNWTGILPGLGSIGLKHHKPVVEAAATHSTESSETSKIEANGAKNGHEEAEKSENKALEAAKTIAAESKSKKTEKAVATTSEENSAKKHETETVIIPFLRAPSADLNFTIGLAMIAVIMIQFFGISGLGFFKYMKKFWNFTGPINFIVGLLEGISEFSKIISFSLRLFGNIFAGEVLLMVIAFLVPLIAPLPFLGLEIFVGFVQALIFSTLTLVFSVVAVHAAEH